MWKIIPAKVEPTLVLIFWNTYIKTLIRTLIYKCLINFNPQKQRSDISAKSCQLQGTSSLWSFARVKWKTSKDSPDIYTHEFNMSSFLGEFVPLNPWRGAFSPGPHWAKFPDHFTGSLYHACSNSSKIYQTFSILIHNHTCTFEGNSSRSVSSNASDVWDKLPIHVSFAPTLLVFSTILSLHVYLGSTINTPTIKVRIY